MKTHSLPGGKNQHSIYRLAWCGLALALVLILPDVAHADLCGDAAQVRFASFPNAVTRTVTCPGVELPCAGDSLGVIGGCRFAIDLESQSIRIDDFTEADYGTGATLTFSDLDPLLCDGTVTGELADVRLEFANTSGFVPEVQFTSDSVRVSLAKGGVIRWQPGDFIELQLDFQADCPAGTATNRRSGWVPNVGRLEAEERPLGDLFTFRCPAGGTVSAFVDTKDDTDSRESDLDPVLAVYDPAGTLLAVGDDQQGCTYPPVCGFACPAVRDVSCGSGGLFSVVIRDFGTAAKGGVHCQEGGGYELTLDVVDQEGLPVAASEIGLGGGAPRALPPWAAQQGFPVQSPALDDENVPVSFPVFPFVRELTPRVEGVGDVLQKIEGHDGSPW